MKYIKFLMFVWLALFVAVPAFCAAGVASAKKEPAAKKVDLNEESFLKAVSSGEAKKVAQLLASGTKPDTTDKDGRSALMIAVDTNHPDIARMLLNTGAQVNFSDDDDATPLM